MSTLSRTVVVLLLALIATTAHSDRRIGNAADAIELAFDTASNEASYRVGLLALRPGLLEERSNPPVAVAEFLTPEVLLELSKDIRASPIRYLSEEDTLENEQNSRGACAWTNLPESYEPSLDVVRIYKHICAPFVEQDNGFSFAMSTMIHESVHHLLRRYPEHRPETYEEEERFCNDAAHAILQTFDVLASPEEDRSAPLPRSSETPEARGFHGAVWTGKTGDLRTSDRMFIWGGCRESAQSIHGCGRYFGDGGLFQVKTQEWTSVVSSALRPRAHHHMHWLNRENRLPESKQNKVLIWGGCSGGQSCGDYLNDGVLLDPFTGESSRISMDGAPVGRLGAAAVTTNQYFVVWGGERGRNTQGSSTEVLGSGAVYNIADDRWRSMKPVPGSILSPRIKHTAVWTGESEDPAVHNKVIFWGGCGEERVYSCLPTHADGAIYDIDSDTWERIPPPPAGVLEGRSSHSAHWTGEHMVIFGGLGESRYLNDGAAFHLKSRTWKSLSGSGSLPRAGFLSAWTGSMLLVAGGDEAPGRLQERAAHFRLGLGDRPWQRGSWRTSAGLFLARGAAAVWTGYSWVLWGGQVGPVRFTADGTEYVPPLR